MNDEVEYADLRGHLRSLEDHPGWRAIVAECRKRVEGLAMHALSMNTLPDETQQIKRAIQELQNHGPSEVHKAMLAAANRKMGVKS